jgi:hypothetical protein
MNSIVLLIGYSAATSAAMFAMDAGEDVIAFLCCLLMGAFFEADLKARLRAIDE